MIVIILIIIIISIIVNIIIIIIIIIISMTPSSVITNPNEWRHFKSIFETFNTPVEDGLFDAHPEGAGAYQGGRAGPQGVPQAQRGGQHPIQVPELQGRPHRDLQCELTHM